MFDHRALNSRHPIKLLALGLVLALGANGAAQAQSLQDLYDAARAYDATYLAARALADSAQYRAAQVDALGRPSVGLGVSATNQQIIPPNRYTTVNGQQVQVAGDRVTATTVQAGLNARYALFNRGNRISIDQAQRGLSVAQADLEAAEQDLIVRVSQAYFDVLAAQDALGTTRASKAAIAEQLASAKRNFEVGTATITDTREAQARFDLVTAAEIGADNDLRIKGVTLEEKYILPPFDYAPHGGAFPVRIRGSLPIGTITVSGLPQIDDHALVVAVIADHLATRS